MEDAEPVRDPDLERCAHLLANFTSLWDSSDDRDKQEVVRLVFEQVVIEDSQIIAVKPRPEMRPFFIERDGVEEARRKRPGARPGQGASSAPDRIRTCDLRFRR